MRYYKIIITDPDGNLVQRPSSVPGTEATYTSFANDQSLPGALQIELDIPLKAYATPMGGSFIRVWGISLEEIASASQMNPKLEGGDLKTFKIQIYAGMQKGLPLANPDQAGLIAEGSILKSFGNWIGTDQTLDIIFGPDLGTNAAPKNISFNWKANTLMDAAISTTLNNAFPNVLQNINISSNLKLDHDSPGTYGTLEQFAQIIKSLSKTIMNDENYAGVDIFLKNGAFFVNDQTEPTEATDIVYQDLIGQPTWIGGIEIQFKCVMRADISIGDYITLPQTVVTTTAAAASSLVNLSMAFAGTFYISEIRHVGNFRNADAASWVTTFNAVPQQTDNLTVNQSAFISNLNFGG